LLVTVVRRQRLLVVCSVVGAMTFEIVFLDGECCVFLGGCLALILTNSLNKLHTKIGRSPAYSRKILLVKYGRFC
jgi:hypothetical protein